MDCYARHHPLPGAVPRRRDPLPLHEIDEGRAEAWRLIRRHTIPTLLCGLALLVMVVTIFTLWGAPIFFLARSGDWGMWASVAWCFGYAVLISRQPWRPFLKGFDAALLEHWDNFSGGIYLLFLVRRERRRAARST